MTSSSSTSRRAFLKIVGAGILLASSVEHNAIAQTLQSKKQKEKPKSAKKTASVASKSTTPSKATGSGNLEKIFVGRYKDLSMSVPQGMKVTGGKASSLLEPEMISGSETAILVWRLPNVNGDVLRDAANRAIALLEDDSQIQIIVTSVTEVQLDGISAMKVKGKVPKDKTFQPLTAFVLIREGVVYLLNGMSFTAKGETSLQNAFASLRWGNVVQVQGSGGTVQTQPPVFGSNKVQCQYCRGAGKITCSHCNASGFEPLDNSKPCPICLGAKEIMCTNCTGLGVVTR
jgi:hypothetical protein